MNMVEFTAIKHKGDCYRNTSIGKAYTEESTRVESAEKLLLDNNSKFIESDEAIFGDILVTDGDIRGSLNFI